MCFYVTSWNKNWMFQTLLLEKRNKNKGLEDLIYLLPPPFWLCSLHFPLWQDKSIGKGRWQGGGDPILEWRQTERTDIHTYIQALFEVRQTGEEDRQIDGQTCSWPAVTITAYYYSTALSPQQPWGIVDLHVSPGESLEFSSESTLWHRPPVLYVLSVTTFICDRFRRSEPMDHYFQRSKSAVTILSVPN